MGIFRKKETLNEQQLRDAGLDRIVFNAPEPLPIQPARDLQPSRRQLDADAAVTAHAPGIQGDYATFTVLPEGDLIVTSEETDGDLAPLADAIEEHMSPPYRARASRQEGDLWAVGAEGIDVEQFAYPDAETLQLSLRDGKTEFRIDDGPTDVAPPPELRQLGERAGAEYFVVARRIDGDYWDVGVNLF